MATELYNPNVRIKIRCWFHEFFISCMKIKQHRYSSGWWWLWCIPNFLFFFANQKVTLLSVICHTTWLSLIFHHLCWFIIKTLNSLDSLYLNCCKALKEMLPRSPSLSLFLLSRALLVSFGLRSSKFQAMCIFSIASLDDISDYIQ